MSVVNLNTLNESLDKIYESADVTLYEAWNDSFPKWLKDRLSQVVLDDGLPGHGSRSDKYSQKYFGSPRTSYVNARGESNSGADLSLPSKLLGNIDPDTIEVHEGEVPTKRTDPRLKAPNVPIWGFPNGQVFIPGFNDNEETTIVDGKKRGFKYVPAKYLMANADKFAYFDETQAGPSTYELKRDSRRQTRQELKDLGYSRKGKDPDEFLKKTYGNFDKSGYLLDPSRLKNKLEEIKASRWSEELQKIHDELEEYRDDIVAAMSYYDPFEDKDEYSQVIRAAQLLKDAIGNFNSYSKTIEDAVNGGWYDEDYLRKYIARQIRYLRSNSFLQELKELGNDIFLSGADWLI